MRTIGLIGGMSWESTVTYYQEINRLVKERLGGLHSAKILIFSVDFEEIEACQTSGDWNRSARILAEAAQALERAGAELILICTNTMHKVFSEVQAGVSVPLLHIADATADALERANISTVALLGTKYTMRENFYKQRLLARGLKVLIPDESDVELVNQIIFGELCLGELKSQSKAEFLRIIGELSVRGAQGVILGCTEIGLLISQADTLLPVFDTTLIHAAQAADWALA